MPRQHDSDTTTTLPCVDTTMTKMTGCPWPMPRRHDADNEDEDNEWEEGDTEDNEGWAQ